MRAGRPMSLAELRRDRMHQLPSLSAQDRVKSARSVLRQAHSFRRAATAALGEELTLPAVSSLHEAARLAVSAVAALDGYRFSNSAGAHEAVIDYAFASKLVDRVQFAQLDELRELRHQVNYPADMIEPSRREVTQFEGLVDEVLKLAATRLPTPKIPPPPSTGSEPQIG
jgi:hypothetical protein